MTRPAADSVKVTWSGTGTGPMSLGSNVSGFGPFPASADGLPVSYEIAHQTATTERENGLGTYTASGNTLSRDFVTFSTAGAPTKVSFSTGTKHVRLTALASDFVENRAATDPTSADGIDAGYIAGRSRWLNTANSTLWFCVDHSAGSPGAVWVQVGGGGAGSVSSVNGETGTVVLDATEIDIAALVPGSYTPANASVEGHFGGVDSALAALTAGSDATPTQVVSNAAAYALTSASQLHTNSEVRSHQASVDFEVPAATSGGRKWLIKPLHDGCVVSVVGDVGSVNGVSGGSARLVNGGIAIIEVDSNAGSVPVVFVRGDVIIAATDTGAKTYDNDDAGQVFRVTTGTQTFSAAANYEAGFEVVIKRETAGTITIDGNDADYTISGPDMVYVSKDGTALTAVGKAGVVTLDAA